MNGIFWNSEGVRVTAEKGRVTVSRLLYDPREVLLLEWADPEELGLAPPPFMEETVFDLERGEASIRLSDSMGVALEKPIAPETASRLSRMADIFEDKYYSAAISKAFNSVLGGSGLLRFLDNTLENSIRLTEFVGGRSREGPARMDRKERLWVV